jgi:flagellar hook-length control protein FliK
MNSDAAAAPATTAPAQAVIAAAIVPAPKPAVSKTPETAEETPQKIPSLAGRETPVAEPQAASPKTAAGPGADSASQTPNNAVKQQAGVQTVAADAAPDVKTDAPAPASSGTSTSFADLLARGAPADGGKPAATHPAMQAAPQAAVQVYSRIVERFDGRAQRFEVRLDPAELGRVDVRIEIGADKKVHAVLAAHDSAALSDLMRGQRALERALSDAGIDLKDGGLKFELANDSNRSLAGQEQRRDAWPGEEASVWRGFSTVDVSVETDVPVATASYRRTSRLDLVA